MSCRTGREEFIRNPVDGGNRDRDITGWLQAWQAGNDQAFEVLVDRLYRQLRQAGRRVAFGSLSCPTLSPTALVHEAILLLRLQRVSWQSRGHFLAVAIQLMRRVLLRYGEHRRAHKRGNGLPDSPIPMDLAGRPVPLEEALALDQALSSLALLDPRQARVVELRFYAGLDVQEVAEVLEISATTVKREWRTARLWLKRELLRGTPEPREDRRS